jgi:ribonuclease P protein component
LIWRISERRAFQTLARSGRRARTQTLWCSFVIDPAASPLRVAFALGRSLAPATQRNRLRRRLRAHVTDVAERAGLSSGWLLIGAKPAALEQTFESLGQEVTALITQVHGPAVATDSPR